jgi:DNA topoisomerase-1
VADAEIEKIVIEDEPTDEVCELCGKPMVIKQGRFGRFIACSGYPECKQVFWDKPVDKKCPRCGALMTERKTKQTTLICSNRACGYKE